MPIQIYDISPLISEKTAVFPGDEPYRRTVSLDQAQGDNLTLSAIQSTLHIGAHADAPSHYHAQGGGIEARDLNYYLGLCQVIAVEVPRGARIGVEALGGREPEAPRVLFSTGSFPDPNEWNEDFNHLAPELVRLP